MPTDAPTLPASAVLLLDPAADALRRLASDLRAEQSLRERTARRFTPPVPLANANELRAAEATVAQSRSMAHGALDRLARALPPGDLRTAALAQCAVLAGDLPLCADVLEQRADAWLALELPARAA